MFSNSSDISHYWQSNELWIVPNLMQLQADSVQDEIFIQDLDEKKELVRVWIDLRLAKVITSRSYQVLMALVRLLRAHQGQPVLLVNAIHGKWFKAWHWDAFVQMQVWPGLEELKLTEIQVLERGALWDMFDDEQGEAVHENSG